MSAPTARPTGRGGYALVASSFVVLGVIGALVNFATAPASLLLVLRFGTRRAGAGGRLRAAHGRWPRGRRPGISPPAAPDGRRRRRHRCSASFVAIRDDERGGRHVPELHGARVRGRCIAPRVVHQPTDRTVVVVGSRWRSPAWRSSCVPGAHRRRPRRRLTSSASSPASARRPAARHLLRAGRQSAHDARSSSGRPSCSPSASLDDAFCCCRSPSGRRWARGYSLTSNDLVSRSAARSSSAPPFAYMIFMDTASGDVPRAARLDPRLPRAGLGAAVRARPARRAAVASWTRRRRRRDPRRRRCGRHAGGAGDAVAVPEAPPAVEAGPAP